MKFYSALLGLIAQVPESFYDFLLKLQKNLTKTVKSVGKIDYAYWRTFSNEKKSEAANNFIDGDIIESFLDLNRSQMAECIEDLTVNKCTVLFFIEFLMTINCCCFRLKMPECSGPQPSMISLKQWKNCREFINFLFLVNAFMYF